MAVTGLTTVAYIILYLTVAIDAQYSDDSDYKDFEFYEEVPVSYVGNFENDHLNIVQDDYYILNDFEDAVPRGRRCDVCPEMHDNVDLSFKIIDEVPKKERAHDVQLDWYKPQRIYRYTKHRIPGYDYEEIDHVFARNPQQCDEKSIWAHCVCRFTCTEPDVVDCYSPCRSGCECKEEYVFDEKTNRCMLPEECPKDEDYIDV
ncbi:uncharacterized protein LOC117227537 isoform X1 [Megalopta genalis]|uniref:uncharacterized protein LOC117227537 isoform X1 n=1 Tax=Megalopta genalis TaxID=115081 RepID=UPI0014431014|nr:uncharacterized protein LOC117227537 isoform X1 [Megalopta genalis]